MPPPSLDSAVPDSRWRGNSIELGELDLQLPLSRPRAPREDIENELRPIDDFSLNGLLDLPQLRRRQLGVEDHHVGVRFGARCRQRHDFSRAKEG
jgi:hypothetical protein